MIKTWQQRCEEHPDHDGIVTNQMIQARMQEEIDDLRAALEQPKFEQAMMDAIIGGTGVMLGDKRINPASIYKQSEQEPVGHADLDINNVYIFSALEARDIPVGRTPLYTAPQYRKPVAWRKNYQNSGYTYYDARWKNIPPDAEPLYL